MSEKLLKNLEIANETYDIYDDEAYHITETNSIEIGDGVASGSKSVAAGSKTKSTITNILGSQVEDYITTESPEAKGECSIAIGNSSTAHSSMSGAFGAKNQAGFLGYYIHSMNGRTLTLTKSQSKKETPNSDILSKWEEGYDLCIINDTAYPFCAKIASVNKDNGTVTVDRDLPFTTIVNGGTEKPHDRSIIAIPPVNVEEYKIGGLIPTGQTFETYRPIAVGEVKFGFGSYTFGFDNIAAGTLSTAIGQRNTAVNTASFVTGRENTGSFAALVGGYRNTVTGSAGSAVGSNNTVSGDRAHAEGHYTTAEGAYSHSEGWGNVDNNNIAKGAASHVEGRTTKAYLHSSHAEGYATTAGSIEADGNAYQTAGAHAEGQSTLAKENASHAEGRSTKALTRSSHAEGELTQAGTNNYRTDANGKYVGRDGQTLPDADQGDIYKRTKIGEYAHAEGYNTKAIEEAAHAEGSSTIASGKFSHAEGYNTQAVGSRAHSEGNNTQALKNYAHSEGNNTIADGQSSHAEGEQTKASNAAAHAEGTYTEATGNGAHAEGAGSTNIINLASGYASHVEGRECQSKGYASHAEGFRTKALGGTGWKTGVTHAEGCETIATADFQHVQGKYNTNYGNATTPDAGNYAHIVGNGESDAKRSNAHTLDWSGNAWYAGTGTFTDVILEDAENGNVNVKSTLSSHSSRLTNLEQTAIGQGGLSLVISAENEDFASHSSLEIYSCAQAGGTVIFDDLGRIYTLSWVGDTEEAIFNYIDNDAAYVYYLTIDENKNITRFYKALSASGDVNLDSIIGTETDEPTANTIYGAKNYTDEEISKLNILSEETITTIATQEAEKVKNELLGGEGLNETYDTIKEISDWLSDDTTGAVKIVNDIGTLQKEQVGKKLDNHAIVLTNPNNIATGAGSLVAGRYNGKQNILSQFVNLKITDLAAAGPDLAYEGTVSNIYQAKQLVNRLKDTYNFEMNISNFGRIQVYGAYINNDKFGFYCSNDYGTSIDFNEITAIYQECGAQADSATVLGEHNLALGALSHVEGACNETFAGAAHAEGHGTFARGYASHAQGRATEARGHSSFASGKGTFASGAQQSVFGTYNIIDNNDITGKPLAADKLDADGKPAYQYPGDINNYNETKTQYAMIVGNGTNDKPSNAATLDWKGNAWYQGTIESAGIILTSPNGSKFKLTVDDNGNLTTVKL